jgi:hypothetical protein
VFNIKILRLLSMYLARHQIWADVLFEGRGRKAVCVLAGLSARKGYTAAKVLLRAL